MLAGFIVLGVLTLAGVALYVVLDGGMAAEFDRRPDRGSERGRVEQTLTTPPASAGPPVSPDLGAAVDVAMDEASALDDAGDPMGASRRLSMAIGERHNAYIRDGGRPHPPTDERLIARYVTYAIRSGERGVADRGQIAASRRQLEDIAGAAATRNVAAPIYASAADRLSELERELG